jgi:glutamine synthetase
MEFTNGEILDKLKEDNVELINLQFTDIMGSVKSVTVPVSKFADILEDYLWFDGSSIEGFTRIFESDMLLKPDLNTYAVIPWHHADTGNIARFICDVLTPDRQPYESDPRYILKKVLKEAEEMGYIFNTGPELEFFLFKKGNGVIQRDSSMQLEPHDKGQYFDHILDLGFETRREMTYILQKMGIEVEASHHEVAYGQHEIDFKYDNALTTADRVMTMKTTLKVVAEKHGLYATFMPKPIAGINGSGMHVHQSLFDKETGENLFFDKNDKYNLSEIAYHFMAGQLEHIKAMSAILNPIVNSYKRLVPGYEAATYICWAQTNRSALIRVPRYSAGKDKATRIEIRNPDPSANPYLAFAVLLKAGLDGIKNKMKVPPPVEDNVYEFTFSELEDKHISFLPGSLWHSIRALTKDEVIKNVLAEDLYKKYIYAKEKEWDSFRLHVSDWEINQYLYNM